MDKETLSNYGWIVICVLVLAVMIALATPFGTFIAGAIKSTTAGFFMVNQNALGSAGININDQLFPNGLTLSVDQQLGSDAKQPAEATGTTYTLSGIATSDKGIKSLTVNGTAVTVGADGRWSVDLMLVQGEATEITVIAIDNDGNERTECGYVGYIQYVDMVLTCNNRGKAGYTKETTDWVIPGTFYSESDRTWYKVIGIEVTSNNAMTLNATNLKSITIPDTVTYIGEGGAFYNCESLETVIIQGNNLTTIGHHAFSGCKNLKSINIPDSVTNIGYCSFEYCKNLSEVKIPEGVEVLEGLTFSRMECDFVLYLPSTIKSIGLHAFFNNPGADMKHATIIYNGTMEQWNTIEKNDDWNVNKTANKIVCNDGTITY